MQLHAHKFFILFRWRVLADPTDNSTLLAVGLYYRTVIQNLSTLELPGFPQRPPYGLSFYFLPFPSRTDSFIQHEHVRCSSHLGIGIEQAFSFRRCFQ